MGGGREERACRSRVGQRGQGALRPLPQQQRINRSALISAAPPWLPGLQQWPPARRTCVGEAGIGGQQDDQQRQQPQAQLPPELGATMGGPLLLEHLEQLINRQPAVCMWKGRAVQGGLMV